MSMAINGNPKDAIGSLKATLGAIPRRILFELGLAFLEGETKYFRHNFLASPVRAMVYIEALDRHVSAWVEGEDEDPDTCDEDEAGPIPGTGVSHLMKAGACLFIIRAAQVYGTLIDDRPPAQPRGWLEGLSKVARRIIERNGALYERGAYTEANRADWPAMNERLAHGPIAKGGSAQAARAHAARVDISAYTRGRVVVPCDICRLLPCGCGDPEGFRGSDY